jgi:hypothetical protein
MIIRTLATAGLFALATASATLPALAQTTTTTADVTIGPNGVPEYTVWQTGWDSGTFDHAHVILGTVADFKPFRLQVARDNGVTQSIDLKNGTTILPVGMTPSDNQRVAVVGYYSKGTFIANRVILHG